MLLTTVNAINSRKMTMKAYEDWRTASLENPYSSLGEARLPPPKNTKKYEIPGL